MKKFIPILFLLVAGCQQQPQQDVQIVTEKQADSKIQVRVGDVLTIKLNATPGTGYGWHVGKITADHLQQVGKPQFESKDWKPGRSQVEMFKFKVMSEDSTPLELYVEDTSTQ